MQRESPINFPKSEPNEKNFAVLAAESIQPQNFENFPKNYSYESEQDDDLLVFKQEESMDGYLDYYFDEGNMSETNLVNTTTLK